MSSRNVCKIQSGIYRSRILIISAIARLGGDEFAIALPHLDNDDKIRVIGD